MKDGAIVARSSVTPRSANGILHAYDDSICQGTDITGNGSCKASTVAAVLRN